jgi:glycosyltransferase involved in cell wall biosynthesis
MKLLILTQKVDQSDPILGFFHRWIEEFATRFEKVTVICLEEGVHDLPNNVRVLSLGKEKKRSRINYVINYLHFIWRERKEYDTVFVHMNQEYVLLAGGIWRLMGKKIYLWRNHAKGSVLTRLAGMLCHKVFYTSPSSYTACFKNAVQMPVGIDTDFFKPDSSVERVPGSVLFLGRMSPVKKVLEFVEWAKEKGYKVTLAGPVPKIDEGYWRDVQRKMTENMTYVGPVNPEEARNLYQSHEMYANFTPAGSFDKTIFEAAACGARVVVRNEDLKKGFDPQDHSLKKLADALKQEMT